MPELPEVETLRRGLEAGATTAVITAVVVANPKILAGQPEAQFRERVTGAVIGDVARRGKYLLLSLRRPVVNADAPVPSSLFLCIHLKMRGQLLLENGGTPVGPYHCISLALDKGVRELRFYDMWTWGEMRALTQAETEAIPGLAQMGLEPLGGAWGADDLLAKVAKRKQAIKSVLLDQRIVAGVGNIYADESLYRAGLHPERAAGTLTEAEAARLVTAVQGVLSEALNGGGTMSDNYVDVAGAVGRFSPQVYERGGKPCLRCGETLIRIKLGGRGTVYCGTCQT